MQTKLHWILGTTTAASLVLFGVYFSRHGSVAKELARVEGELTAAHTDAAQARSDAAARVAGARQTGQTAAGDARAAAEKEHRAAEAEWRQRLDEAEARVTKAERAGETLRRQLAAAAKSKTHLETKLAGIEKELAAARAVLTAATPAKAQPEGVKWERLRVGMTRDQVENLLGEPARVERNDIPVSSVDGVEVVRRGAYEAWWYDYDPPRRVRFTGDKLYDWMLVVPRDTP